MLRDDLSGLASQCAYYLVGSFFAFILLLLFVASLSPFVFSAGIPRTFLMSLPPDLRQIIFAQAGIVLGVRSSPGRARLDIECADEAQAGIYVDLLDAARKEEGLGIGPIYLSTVERVTGLAVA